MGIALVVEVPLEASRDIGEADVGLLRGEEVGLQPKLPAFTGIQAVEQGSLNFMGEPSRSRERRKSTSTICLSS